MCVAKKIALALTLSYRRVLRRDTMGHSIVLRKNPKVAVQMTAWLPNAGYLIEKRELYDIDGCLEEDLGGCTAAVMAKA